LLGSQRPDDLRRQFLSWDDGTAKEPLNGALMGVTQLLLRSDVSIAATELTDEDAAVPGGGNHDQVAGADPVHECIEWTNIPPEVTLIRKAVSALHTNPNLLLRQPGKRGNVWPSKRNQLTIEELINSIYMMGVGPHSPCPNCTRR